MGKDNLFAKGETAELDKYKAFPTFMKDYLQNEHSGVEHIVTDEREEE